jgi:hypothetical protein
MDEFKGQQQGIRTQSLQVNSTVDITGAAFKPGRVTFRFETGGITHWDIERSYLSVRARLLVSDAAPGAMVEPVEGDGLAWAMNPVACMFDSANFKIGGQIVSNCQNDMPLASSFYERLTKSGSYLSNLGEDLGMWQGRVLDRVAKTSTDVNASELADGAKSNTEFVWTPPLSIFTQSSQRYIPGGVFELELAISPNWYNQMVENRAPAQAWEFKPTAVSTAANQYNIEISEVYLNIGTVDLSSPVSSYQLDLTDIYVNTNALTATTGNQTKQFDVPSTTIGIGVAYSTAARDTDIKYSSSRFVVGANKLAATTYNGIDHDHEELKLSNFSVQYAGLNFPAPNAQPKFSNENPAGPLLKNAAGNHINQFTRRYYETYLNADQATVSQSGPEKLDEWQSRGMYLYFDTPKDSRDPATRVVVNSSFSPAPATVPAVIVMALYKSRATVQLSDGRITSVQLLTA